MTPHKAITANMYGSDFGLARGMKSWNIYILAREMGLCHKPVAGKTFGEEISHVGSCDLVDVEGEGREIEVSRKNLLMNLNCL